MEDRTVEIDGEKLLIRIGYGAYHRIDYLRLLVEATRPIEAVEDDEPEPGTEQDETPEKDVALTQEQIDTGVEAAIAALNAEGLLKEGEEDQLTPSDNMGGVQSVLDMLDVEGKVAEKVREAKFKIIKLAVRRQDGAQLDDEFLEDGLSPVGGETLFTQVMETFEVLKSAVEDVELKKK